MAELVDCTGLENRHTLKVSGVRIPISPHKPQNIFGILGFFY